VKYHIPIYSCGWFYTVRSAAAFDRKAAIVLTPPRRADPCALGACGWSNAPDLRIVAGVWAPPCDRTAVIAHEATHAAQAVALYVGMDYILETEGFAYIVQWFASKLEKDC
jgi:hypothetical protein